MLVLPLPLCFWLSLMTQLNHTHIQHMTLHYCQYCLWCSKCFGWKLLQAGFCLMTSPLTLSVAAWFSGPILICTIHSSVLESAFSPAILPHSFFSDERHIVSKHRPWMCALQLWYDCLRPFQWSEQGESCSCLYFQVQCQSDGIWEVIRFRWGDDLQSS